MPKYFNGFTLEKKTVEANGQKEDIVIAMTNDEYKDKSHREYMEQAMVEKVTSKLNHKKVPEVNPEKRANLAALIKEHQEYRQRRESGNRKFFL